MYSVLLVDDEKFIIESIQNTVPWEECGVSNVLVAQNGHNALDILSGQIVHLLITDIKMPDMDGLTLLKKVRELYPSIRCILLSAYGEFEYARTALKLGIENYLLKPLSVDELTASIQKSLENIDQRKQIDKNLFYDNILLRWITGTISEDELIERTPVLNVNLYSRNYCIVILRRQMPGANLAGISKKYLNALSTGYSVYTLTENPDNCIFILAAYEIEPRSILKQLEAVQPAADPGNGLLIAIGSVVLGNMELSKSYYNAQSALQYAAIFFTSPIVAFDDIYLSHMSQAAQKRILSLLDLPTVESAVAEGHSILESLFSFSSNPQELHRLAGEVGALLLNKTQEYSPQRTPLYVGSMLSTSGRFDREDYNNWFETLITETWLQYHSKNGNISPIVNQAIRYIRENYSGSVSIKEFCAKFEMNASYLGYLFKNETGMFFNDYVSRIRIKHAMWFLENTNEKISDISEKIGFSNASYFIKCFRSQTGVSPVKYRQTMVKAGAEKELQ